MIFLGPSNLPVTGQSHSFHTTFKIFNGNKKKICYPSKNTKHFALKTTWFFLRLIYHSFSNSFNFYLTISRSRGGFYRDLIIFCISQVLNRRLIVHLHGADFNLFYSSASRIDKYFINLMYRRIKFGIVLVDEMKDQFKDFPNIATYVLPNFHLIDIPLQEIYAKADKFQHTDLLRCLFLSNIIDEKGIWETINATKICIDNKKHISLNIVGEIIGHDQVVSINRTTLNKVTEKYIEINFLGPLYDLKKQEQLRKADVFVLPTYYPTEALPIAALEAMAAGLIILITDHNYLSTVFSNETGRLVLAKKTNSIVEAINDITDNRRRYRDIMINNSKRAMTDFSLERYKSNFNSIILDVERK